MPDYTDDNPYGFAPGFEDNVRQLEGFTPQAQWDVHQHSNGYGTRAWYPGEVIDRPEADRRLRLELGQASANVDNMGVPMTPGQRSALTSLTYNAGPGWQHAGLGDAVRNGQWDRARDLFQQYNKAGGQFNQGLANRRATELGWWDGNTAPQAAPNGPTGASTPQQGTWMASGSPTDPPLRQSTPTGGPVADDYDAYLQGAMRALAQPQDQGLIPGLDRAAQYLMAIGTNRPVSDANKDAEARNRMMLGLMQHQQTRQDTLQNRQIIDQTRNDRLNDMAFTRANNAYNSSEDSFDPRTGRKVPFQTWLQGHPEFNLTPGRSMIGGQAPNTPMGPQGAGGAPQGLPTPVPNPQAMGMGQAGPADLPPTPTATATEAMPTAPTPGAGGPALQAYLAAQSRPQAAPQPQQAPQAPPEAPTPQEAPQAAPAATPQQGGNGLQLSPLTGINTYQDWGNQIGNYVRQNGGKLTPELLKNIHDAFPDSSMGDYVQNVAQGRMPIAGKDGNFAHQQLNSVITALSAVDPRIANAYENRKKADLGFNGEDGSKGTVAKKIDSFARLTGQVDDNGNFNPGHIAEYTSNATAIPEVNAIEGASSIPRLQGPEVTGFSAAFPGATQADWAHNYNRQLRGEEKYQGNASDMDKMGHNIGAETENIVTPTQSGQQGRFEQAEDLKGESTPNQRAGALRASIGLIRPQLDEMERNIRNNYALDPDAVKDKLDQIAQIRKGLDRSDTMVQRYTDIAANRPKGHTFANDMLSSPIATLKKVMSGNYTADGGFTQ